MLTNVPGPGDFHCQAPEPDDRFGALVDELTTPAAIAEILGFELSDPEQYRLQRALAAAVLANDTAPLAPVLAMFRSHIEVMARVEQRLRDEKSAAELGESYTFGAAA